MLQKYNNDENLLKLLYIQCNLINHMLIKNEIE